jgi:hypothetical protein
MIVRPGALSLQIRRGLVNGVNGMSDIEGKAAMGSGE